MREGDDFVCAEGFRELDCIVAESADADNGDFLAGADTESLERIED